MSLKQIKTMALVSLLMVSTVWLCAAGKTTLKDIRITRDSKSETVVFDFSKKIEPKIEKGLKTYSLTFKNCTFTGKKNVVNGYGLLEKVYVLQKGGTVNIEMVIVNAESTTSGVWNKNEYQFTIQRTIKKESKMVLSREMEEQLTSNRISLDFKNADIKNILRLFATKTGINIIAGSEVKGNVTVKFKNVPLKSALDSILKAKGYGYIEEAGILRVTTASKLGLAKVETQTKIFRLNWTMAKDVAKSIKPLLSQKIGKISISVDTNNVIITDTPYKVREMELYIQTIDRRTRQVQIEARMVNIDRSHGRDIGVNWYIARDSSTGIFDDVMDSTQLPNNTSDWGSYYNSAIEGVQAPFKGDAPPAIALGTQISGWDLNFTLHALEEEGAVETLENPTIIITDNETAEFEVTNEEPYAEAKVKDSFIVQTVKYKETGVKLFVTPHITDTDHILMELETEESLKSDTKLIYTIQNITNEIPVIDKRRSKTQLIIGNNMPFVVGGFRSKRDDTKTQGTPILREIPYIKHLFKNSSSAVEETELLIFITPSILDEKPLDPTQNIRYKSFDLF